MRKLTILVLGCFLAWIALPARGQGVVVFVDGQQMEGTGTVRDGVTYFPVGPLAEALNLTVSWDPVARVLRINGNQVNPDPIDQGGLFYVPVEAVARTVGGQVHWNSVSRRLDIQTRAAATTPAAGDPVFSLDDRLPAGWRFPNPGLPGSGTTDSGYPSMSPGYQARALPAPGSKSPAKAPDTDGDVFVPRSARSPVYTVTVTNVERVASLKGYYQPRGGYRYVIVYVGQKNMTGAAQVDPGRFHLEDQKGNRYPMIDDLSNFFPVIFRPYGINFGYQVYEVPDEATSGALVLTTGSGSPLRVKL